MRLSTRRSKGINWKAMSRSVKVLKKEVGESGTLMFSLILPELATSVELKVLLHYFGAVIGAL